MIDPVCPGNVATEPECAPIAFVDLDAAKLRGSDALDAMLASLGSLPSDGLLKLRCRCLPDRLVRQLAFRGFRTRSRRMLRDCWDLEVLAAGTPDIVDLRRLEAPGPMEFILEAVTHLEPDRTFMARLPHVPHPLFPELRERNLRWWVHEEADLSALLAVRRQAAVDAT